MARCRGDEAWTRTASRGYARRHAPECDAPMLEVARSVHLSTWPPCIVLPWAARSAIRGGGHVKKTQQRLRKFSLEQVLPNRSRKDRRYLGSGVFWVRDSSLFFNRTDVFAGKRAMSLTVFAPKSRADA